MITLDDANIENIQPFIEEIIRTTIGSLSKKQLIIESSVLFFDKFSDDFEEHIDGMGYHIRAIVNHFIGYLVYNKKIRYNKKDFKYEMINTINEKYPTLKKEYEASF